MTVAVSGDFGKPRPAVVIQSDVFDEHPTVTLALVTSTLTDAAQIRLPISPDLANGLRVPSQLMIDKLMTVPREKVGQAIGHLDRETMQTLDRLLAVFLGLAD